MQTVLLDSGKAALASAIANGTKLKIGAYRIGQAANFAASTSATNVSPVSVYQGTAANISTSLVENDQIRYVITVPESVGPFSVGNIMLFLQDEEGELIPYLHGIQPVPIPKYKSNPPTIIGNRLVFNLTAKYTNISEAFTLVVSSPVYASLPNYRDEYELPNPSYAVYQQAVLQNNTVNGSPGLVVRRSIDNSWYINTFFQRIDDPAYGILKGGIAGDSYLPFYGDYYSCGLYTNSSSDFNNTIDGGASWASPTTADDPIDSGLYTE